MKKHLLAVAFFALAASPAVAVTSYIVPDAFWPDDGDIAAEGSYASSFFTPQIAVPGDIVALGPTGTRVDLDRVEVTPTVTNIATELTAPGTYRISTGEVLGRVATLVATPEGQWRALGEGETVPTGAQSTTLQTVTVADTYVTRATVTREPVDAPGAQLQIHPITHPNQVLVASGLDVELLFNGQPFPNMPIVVYAAGDPETKLDRYVVTDASGRAHVTFDTPGRYVLAVRHRAASPGTEAAMRSYTSSLTLEALTELPTIVEAPEAEPQAPARERRPARRRVGRPDY
ncbi:DUF4198 domain-containing protein [Terricaulis sp.]|uniref:DUF4198 domain-containing protein n=1 Tax=Terricaulis sp. TaxID=2768686 RepID=UPI0037844E4E